MQSLLYINIGIAYFVTVVIQYIFVIKSRIVQHFSSSTPHWSTNIELSSVYYIIFHSHAKIYCHESQRYGIHISQMVCFQ